MDSGDSPTPGCARRWSIVSPIARISSRPAPNPIVRRSLENRKIRNSKEPINQLRRTTRSHRWRREKQKKNKRRSTPPVLTQSTNQYQARHRLLKRGSSRNASVLGSPALTLYSPGWTAGGLDAHRLLPATTVQGLRDLLDDEARRRGYGQQLSIARLVCLRAAGDVGRVADRLATRV
jgi:hypothetical protein